MSVSSRITLLVMLVGCGTFSGLHTDGRCRKTLCRHCSFSISHGWALSCWKTTRVLVRGKTLKDRMSPITIRIPQITTKGDQKSHPVVYAGVSFHISLVGLLPSALPWAHMMAIQGYRELRYISEHDTMTHHKFVPLGLGTTSNTTVTAQVLMAAYAWEEGPVIQLMPIVKTCETWDDRRCCKKVQYL